MLLCGKYPHPQTIVPGGMSTTLSTSVFNEFYVLDLVWHASTGKHNPAWFKQPPAASAAP